MALLKTLEDLSDWDGYRKFLTTELKALENDEAPFHVSREDFDFEVKGKPWSGRVILFGNKGDSSMAALKKLGIQFRSGTCRKDGQKLLVTGISGSLLKAGNKTFGKLPLSCTAVVAGEDPGDSDDDDGKPEKATSTAQDTGNDEKAKAQHKKAKAEVFGLLKAALANNPANRSDLVALYGKAEAHEKKGDFASAGDVFDDLRDLLDAADGKGEVEADADEGEAGAEQGLAAQQKKSLYKRAKQTIESDPGQREAIGRLVQRADKKEKAGDFAAVLEAYEELEEVLDAAGDDDEEDVELDPKSMRDWVQYRLWVRARLRRLSQDGQVLEPFYVSRKKYEFDMGGKTWRGHAVLAGKKARTVFKALKQQGLQFLRGEAYRDGKEVVVEGIPTTAMKVTAKTLKMLRLGFKIRGVDADDDGGEDGKAAPRAASDAADGDAGGLPEALLAWQTARTAATSKLKAIAQAIAAAKHARSASALIELKAVISQLNGNPDTPQRVAEMEQYLQEDDVVRDVCEMTEDIRTPLLAATARLRAAVV